MAKYKLTDTAYLAERLLAPGEVVEVADTVVPGPHMNPVDDAARRAVKAAGNRMVRIDPVEAIIA